MEGRESDSGKGISLTDFRAEHNEAIKKAIAYENKWWKKNRSQQK